MKLIYVAKRGFEILFGADDLERAIQADRDTVTKIYNAYNKGGLI